MKRILASSCLLLSLSCAEKKEFKGSVATGQQKKSGEAKPKQSFPAPPAPQPTPGIPSVIDEVTTAPKTVEDVQEFLIETTSSNEVDMFWVIDNSGSMSEEAAQVRANLDKFMTSISSRVDIKVTLLSLSVGPFGAMLSPEAKADGHQQLDVEVLSFNPINVLATALCPADSTKWPTAAEFETFYGKAKWGPFPAIGNPFDRETEDSPYKVCGITAKKLGELMDGTTTASYNIQGTLKPRSTAAKVIVVVTDDDAVTSIPINDLEKTLGFSPGSMHLFGFLGLANTPNCKIAQRGKWYEQVAQITGGEIFDICDQDWSANFTKLSDQVVEVASSNFKLEARKNLMVSSVRVDGKEIASSAYILDGNTVRVTDSSVLKGAKSVQVQFSYEK